MDRTEGGWSRPGWLLRVESEALGVVALSRGRARPIGAGLVGRGWHRSKIVAGSTALSAIGPLEPSSGA